MLDPKNIIIVDGGEGADDGELDDGEILAGDREDETLTISEEKLEEIWQDSEIILEATNDITIEDLSDDILEGSHHAIEFIADSDNDGSGDFSMNSGDTIQANGSISISGVNLNIGTLETYATEQDNDEITLNSTNTVEAENISTYSGQYPAADITILSGDDVTVNEQVRGDVLSQQDNLDVGDITIISDRGNITITGLVASSSRLELEQPANAGTIRLRATHGNIMTGKISSAVEYGDAGDVFVQSGGSITIDEKIVSSAGNTGNGGSIQLIAEDDITVTNSIRAGGLMNLIHLIIKQGM